MGSLKSPRSTSYYLSILFVFISLLCLPLVNKADHSCKCISFDWQTNKRTNRRTSPTRKAPVKPTHALEIYVRGHSGLLEMALFDIDRIRIYIGVLFVSFCICELQEGKTSLRICLLILIQYANVTDGLTDRRTADTQLYSTQIY